MDDVTTEKPSTAAVETAKAPANHSSAPTPPSNPGISAPTPQNKPKATAPTPQNKPKVTAPTSPNKPKVTAPTPQNKPRSAAPTPVSNPRKHGSKSATILNDANEELSQLIIAGKVKADDARCLKATLKEHISLQEKVEKLKSLLGRSAKAQREAKIDSDAAQKRLGQAMKEIERLSKKLDKLQTRPSHLDLLMDFETNFDKALLSVGQSGGQDTSDIEPITHSKESSNLDTMDAMLMEELGEARNRIEKLETLNTSMMSRSTQLEESARILHNERDDARNSSKRLQMELRMAKLEAEQAHRAMMDKVASLEEMQIEIDLVTKASTKASVRAAKGEEAANSLKTDKNHIQQLESQVQALKEWALASAEAKKLMQERCKILEGKLKAQGRNFGDDKGNPEKILSTKTGSMVIGAGNAEAVIFSLGEHAATVDSRFVILRWKFDSSPSDTTIDFNIMKGKCESRADYAKADYLIKDRVIKGGAGGETEGAFNIDSGCTMLWSNAKAWIRPTTIKYSIEIVALK